MRRLRLKLGAVSGGVAMVAVCAGCSGTSGPTTGWDMGAGSGGDSGGSSGTSPSQSGSGSGGNSGSTGSSSGSGSSSSSGGSGNSSSSGTGASSGSGSSGSSGGSSGSSGGVDAGKVDASGLVDASATPDAGSPGSDAGLCADQSAWLTPMNQARAAVGEAPLVCDPIAAQVALNYANKCNYAHNANRNSDYTALSGKGGLGENIAAGTPTESIAMAVSSWLAEMSSYDHATNTCSSTTPGCGHYTQIVWKNTTAVGCAHVTCTTNSPFGGSGMWDFSVCDYNPPGNFVGQSPY